MRIRESSNSSDNGNLSSLIMIIIKENFEFQQLEVITVILSWLIMVIIKEYFGVSFVIQQLQVVRGILSWLITKYIRKFWGFIWDSIT